MQDELMDVLDRIPPHALSVYLYLAKRAELDAKIGVTQQEISRATRISVGAVREALGWLEQPTYKDATLKRADVISPFISITASGKHHNIKLLPPYAVETRIRFTFEDTDDRRIAVLEKELRRLAGKTNRTRFSVYFRGERHAMMQEIESDIGRAVTVEEAFLLGAMTHAAGPERVRAAWRTKAAHMERPIVGLYAMFMRSAFGKIRQETEERDDVEYQPIVRDESAV